VARAKARDSRALILAAAREEFGQLGYAGGRVERIARRAGVNKQLLFYYFGSKTGLFKAVLDAASHDIADATTGQEKSAPLERLRAVALQVFDAVHANGGLIRMGLLGASPHDAARSAWDEPLKRLSETVRAAVSEGQGLGYVRDDVDPEIVARLVLATAVGCLALPDQDAARLRANVLDLIARALAW
jgi:AcrR family transcriptional regulator